MPDEPEAQVEPVVETPAVEAEPELRPFTDVLAELNRHAAATPDVVREALRQHQMVSGIAGQIAQTQTQRLLAQEKEKARQEGIAAKEQELLRLAEEDPEAFAAQFRTEKQAELAQRDLQSLRSNERRALAEQINKATASFEEWKELTPADQSRLAQAMIGVPDEQVFAAYQKAVVDLIADKRAVKRAEADLADKMKAERAAWETEQAVAKAKQPAPSIRSGNPAGNDTGEPSWPSPEWDAWFEATHLKRRVRS